jgi:ribonuclease III
MALRYSLEPLFQFGTMILRARKFRAVETAIAYKFKSQTVLERALTHSSVRGGDAKRTDNERLEFIGDRVLGLAIVEMLHESHPTANEGDMARRYNVLVRGETCARVARDLGLGAHLILSPSEAENGGRDKENILADAMEAILGAVFIDGGFKKARDVIRGIWTAEQGAQPTTVSADPKSALQEWAQGRGLALPRYTSLIRTGPDHAPQFTAEVTVDGFSPVQGSGASKRSAQQAAASSMLSIVAARPITDKAKATLSPPKENAPRG